ncbi:LSU ribosomal protein L5P [Magnetococcus marinus MC-1]|uniref:Large ribosomal subunit protein uL5 n=1 Tax=Magnetococcus marinus (strain ATCC BAA-1437 / JCM 17883 / MC-1) TaxID=156889 RepID=RL5_MAGMM|nr:50S ribosomal protein L5 [Magnetococcus marinus]A0L5Y5.1 RecName: Full=Large ribosomal subunit protein uL5; AltName: Full=50S ribosomal protein L5 [Magnetococcus marinus MC-1]ABK43378.1 LSU ribosomal protein L5P [Magnetococcus marinus MC-1]
MADLKQVYHDKVVPELQAKFGYSNVMQVPRLQKIVVNMGVGEAIADKNFLNNAIGNLEAITGQKAQTTYAKKSIAGFKLREGQAVGCRVTLRRRQMWEFLDRLINAALPRVRDFRGVSEKAFDGRGNYTMGIKEQIIFPEIDYDKVDKVRGMDICIVTSAKTDDEARQLLAGFNMPFRKKEGNNG